nr:hypothetical protein [Tanacetum cinerariifolium]
MWRNLWCKYRPCGETFEETFGANIVPAGTILEPKVTLYTSFGLVVQPCQNFTAQRMKTTNDRRKISIPRGGENRVRSNKGENKWRYNLRVRFKDNRRTGLQVSDKGTVYVREEAKEMHQSWLDPRLICSEMDASMKAEPMLCLT